MNFSEVETNDAIIIRVESEEAKRQCVDLIREFRDCVAFSIENLEKTEAASLSIRCTSDVPVVYRPYRLATAEKQVLKEIIQKLLANRIIRGSQSRHTPV